MTSANQLTILRMTSAPIFILFVVYGYLAGAVVTFFLAAGTDVLDGLIARQFSQKTALGTFLDPIADKLLLVSAFVVLSLSGLELTSTIPLWLTITVISRDILLVVAVLVINLTLGRRAFPPSLFGKATTLAQLLTVLFVLLGSYLQRPMPFLDPLIYLTLVLTVGSGIHYLARGMRILSTTE